MRNSICGTIAFAAMALLAFVPGAAADDDSTGPALGVARISLVQGDVATMRGDSGDWVAATPNMPIVEGDSVQTRGDARVEIQLAYGNLVRLGSDAEVLFLGLARNQFRFRVLQGTVLYSELPKSEADIDMETPLAAVRPMKPGRYRVSVVGARVTYISVSKGRTEVAFPDQSTTLEKGRLMTIRKGATGTEYELSKIPSRLPLDEWAAARDTEISRSRSYRYVSRDIYGAGDLDNYGEWRYVVDVGYSWFPYVTPAWVPYRHGRWVWLDYYGWSWVGAEPWGWSPYHWGRWYRHNIYGWGWYPGVPTLRHVWRPALVTFFGYGTGYRINQIAWCPLGPGERYEPWYGRRYYGGRARNAIVVDNSVRVYNSYRNARSAVGVSYLDANNFGRGGVQNPRAFRSAGASSPSAIRGPLPVVPDRTSQGRLLPDRSSSRSRGVLTESRRGGSSVLRDGTARIPFNAQRAHVRASVDEFERTHRSATTVRSSTDAGSQRRSSPTVTARGRPSGVASSVRGAPTPARGAVRGSTPSTRVPPPATVPEVSARTRTPTRPSVRLGGGSRQSPSVTSSRTGGARAPTPRPTAPPVFAPRTSSRIRTDSPTRPQVRSPSSRRVPRSAQQRQSSRPTIGSTTTLRRQGTGSATRSTVYAPRTSSRTDVSAGGASRSAPPTYTSPSRSRSSRPAPVYVPRASSRSSRSSRSPAVVSGPSHSGPSYFPRSSSRSSPSYGGARSSSPSYSTGRSRSGSSSPTSRSPSPSSSRSSPSYGASRSSSSGSVGASRSSSGSSRSSSSSSSRSSSSGSSRGSSSSSRDR